MFIRIAVALLLLSGLSSVAYAGCGGPSIDASKAPYNGYPAIQGISTSSDVETRIAADTAAAGSYRFNNGSKTLPVGSTFKITYGDASSECVMVTSTSSTMGAAPIPGTQQAAPAPSGGYGGGGGTNTNGLGLGGPTLPGGQYSFTCYLVDPNTGAKTRIPCG
jgi:hypothetical protein